MIDGPFSETTELIASVWIWKTVSLHEAIEWAKRSPNPILGESEIELPQIFEPEDFGEALAAELHAQVSEQAVEPR